MFRVIYNRLQYNFFIFIFFLGASPPCAPYKGSALDLDGDLGGLQTPGLIILHPPFHKTCVRAWLTVFISLLVAIIDRLVTIYTYRIYISGIQKCYIHLLHIRIKIIVHLIGWTLSTWPSLFRDIDWNADRPVQKPCIDWHYWSIHSFWTGRALRPFDKSLHWCRVRTLDYF